MFTLAVIQGYDVCGLFVSANTFPLMFDAASVLLGHTVPLLVNRWHKM